MEYFLILTYLPSMEYFVFGNEMFVWHEQSLSFVCDAFGVRKRGSFIAIPRETRSFSDEGVVAEGLIRFGNCVNCTSIHSLSIVAGCDGSYVDAFCDTFQMLIKCFCPSFRNIGLHLVKYVKLVVEREHELAQDSIYEGFFRVYKKLKRF